MTILGTVPAARILRVCCYCPQGNARGPLEKALASIGWRISDGLCPTCRDAAYRAALEPSAVDSPSPSPFFSQPYKS